MNLERIILFILVLLTIGYVYSDAQVCYAMYELSTQPNTSVGDIYSYTFLLIRAAVYAATFIGIYKFIKHKHIKLTDAFKFPVFYHVIVSIFWYLLLLLSRENSNFILQDKSWYSYAFDILNSSFGILVCIYFLTGKEKKEGNIRVPASPKARFVHWMIDLTFISFFTFSNFSNFQRELIFQNLFTQRQSILLLFILYMFVYYFVLEFIFLQTIGKLYNNSFVVYNGNRFTSILIRTLCRFIPFEAFTYFSNKGGWHDLLSRTKVLVSKKEMQ